MSISTAWTTALVLVAASRPAMTSLGSSTRSSAPIASSSSPTDATGVVTDSSSSADATVSIASSSSSSVAWNTSPADDLPGKPPDTSAPAHKAFGWSSKRDVRFVWWVPENLDAKTQRTMTVILHGRGFDYRWGWKNHPPEMFRTDDVVLSVDGTSADGEHRWFAPEKKDADALQEFLVEVTHTFGVERVLLYGHVEGGAFALFFAGEHPDLVAGVVAHDCLPPAPPKLAPEAPRPAIVFMHGTLDPDTYFARSLDARGAWSKAGFTLVHLRRLEHSSYEPNPRRADEELAWCDAMTTVKPDVALSAALALASVPKSEASHRQTANDLAGAREILRRFDGKGPAPFAGLDADTAARAKSLADEIDSAGALHVQALRKSIQKKNFKLDGKLPVGHLAAVREDLRGIDVVEAYVKELGYDALFESQQKPAGAILDVWRKNKDAKTTFETVIENLPKAWIYEGLPPDLAEKMHAWKTDEKKLGLSSRASKSWPIFEDWQHAWEDGLKDYAEIWKTWKGP
jgi:predicted esterase